MAIAAAGAVILGEVGEAATLAFLFSISEGLEGYALARTRRSLRALLDLVPPKVTVRRGERELEIDPDDLVAGDRMLVRPGERLGTDGLILAGRSALDLSAITGESLPVEHGPGDQIYAGAINGSGVLEVAATAGVRESSLARVVRIVEEAQERKARGQRLAERVARPLVPGVMLAGVLVVVGGSLLGDPALWVRRALVVLVAAAPCAFAISVPVTVAAAIGAATRFGVLNKGGAALEALERVRVVAVDKTGTLTRSEPAVVEVLAAPGSSSEEVLEMAAALERHSEHPLARAILATRPSAQQAEEVEAVPGQGLLGKLGGRTLRLGRPGFVHPGTLADGVGRLQKAGASVVLIEADGHLLGAVGVRDELREEARAAVTGLRTAGVLTSRW